MSGAGPFSAFPGIQRSLALLEGELLLQRQSGMTTLCAGGESPDFPGEEPISATPLAGEVLDLNLMSRRDEWQQGLSSWLLHGEKPLAELAEVRLLLCSAGLLRVRLQDGRAFSLHARQALLLNDEPGIHISVSAGTTRSMAPQLKRGELDAFVSVLAERNPDPQLRCDVMCREPTVLVGHAEHPLARRSRVGLADTLQFPWLGGAGMDHWGDLIRSSFVAAGLKPPQPRVKTDSLPFACGLLAGTDYLSVLPVALVQPDLDAGRLATISTPVDWSRPVALFYRGTSTHSPAVSAFVMTLRSVAKQLVRRSKGSLA